MNKKIWIWNHYATDMYKNKGGRHYWFAQELIKKGYDVTIFCANTFHNKKENISLDNDLFSEKIEKDVKFIFVKTSISIGNGLDRIKNMHLFYKNVKKAAKKIVKKNKKPDLILASSVHPLTMVAGIQTAKKLNIPCICEVRDLWPEAIFSFGKLKENSILGKILVKGEHWIYKNADSLIFTKEGDMDYLLEKKWDVESGGDIFLDKVYYINNGLDIEKFDKLSNSKNISFEYPRGKFIVTYVGAIRPVNNVMNIISTAELLKEEKGIHFVIYGDGNQKEDLEKLILEKNLENIELKGFVPKNQIPLILKHSDLNLLNYSSEKYNWSRGNSSNKLFEYMASGKPIISTAKMGYSIIDRYNCGYELEKNTPETLAEKILEIKEMNLEKYNVMCENARKGSKDFDFKILTDKLENVIKNLKLLN